MADNLVKVRRTHRSLLIGTYDDPIALINDRTARKELLAHLDLGCFDKKDEVFTDDFKGINFNKWGSSERDYYIDNVIFNKYLNHLETKLALRIYRLLFDSEDRLYMGAVFIVRHTRPPYNKVFDRRFEGGVYVRGYHKTKTFWRYDYENFHNLYDELQTLSLETCSSGELAAALQRLHDFGYITLTDIVEENTESRRAIAKETAKNTDNDPTKRRPRLKHIRIFRWMVHTLVWTKLLTEAPSEPSIPQKPKSAKKAEEAADIVDS